MTFDIYLIKDEVPFPYKLIAENCKNIESCQKREKSFYEYVMQVAWNIVNDTYKTVICLHYSSKTVACASLYMAGSLLDVDMVVVTGKEDSGALSPLNKVMDVSMEEILQITGIMAQLYEDVENNK